MKELKKKWLWQPTLNFARALKTMVVAFQDLLFTFTQVENNLLVTSLFVYEFTRFILLFSKEIVKKVKVCFCIAQYPFRLKALYISPPCRPVHSGTNSTTLGSIPATHGDYSLTFPPPSIARYSFTQLGRRGQNENAQTSKQAFSFSPPHPSSPSCINCIYDQTNFPIHVRGSLLMLFTWHTPLSCQL